MTYDISIDCNHFIENDSYKIIYKYSYKNYIIY